MAIRPQTRFGPILLGLEPKVVGTISRRETLARPAEFRCDVVEVRLDLIGADTPDWLEKTATIPLPTIVTIRLASEGGRWMQSDELRWLLFEQALEKATTVDIEYRSALLRRVSDLACRLQKPLIISYHDFEKTPPLSELRQILRTAANYGTVVKIAALTRTEDDVATLRALLDEQCSASVCVLGMGPLGPRTRFEFPRLGSCFTYGYLDEAVAPGQVSASELMQQLKELCA